MRRYLAVSGQPWVPHNPLFSTGSLRGLKLGLRPANFKNPSVFITQMQRFPAYATTARVYLAIH